MYILSMQTPKSHVPTLYYENAFWRFILDAKQEAEPRFRQFTENLRNYVASGLVLKAGVLLHGQPRSLSNGIASYGLIVVGVAATFLSECQLFGFSIITFHWYVGVSFNRRNDPNLWESLREQAKFMALMFLPLLLVLAMWKFVSSSVWPPIEAVTGMNQPRMH